MGEQKWCVEGIFFGECIGGKTSKYQEEQIYLKKTYSIITVDLGKFLETEIRLKVISQKVDRDRK